MNKIKTVCAANRLDAIPVPIAVRIFHRSVKVRELLNWVPGTLISFDQLATSRLSLTIRDQEIGQGHAVKLGQRLAICLETVGRDKHQRSGAKTETATD